MAAVGARGQPKTAGRAADLSAPAAASMAPSVLPYALVRLLYSARSAGRLVRLYSARTPGRLLRRAGHPFFLKVRSAGRVGTGAVSYPTVLGAVVGVRFVGKGNGAGEGTNY